MWNISAIFRGFEKLGVKHYFCMITVKIGKSAAFLMDSYDCYKATKLNEKIKTQNEKVLQSS